MLRGRGASPRAGGGGGRSDLVSSVACFLSTMPYWRRRRFPLVIASNCSRLHQLLERLRGRPHARVVRLEGLSSLVMISSSSSCAGGTGKGDVGRANLAGAERRSEPRDAGRARPRSPRSRASRGSRTTPPSLAVAAASRPSRSSSSSLKRSMTSAGTSPPSSNCLERVELRGHGLQLRRVASRSKGMRPIILSPTSSTRGQPKTP